jgi:RNA polymerase sigma-54 factor
MLSQHQLQRQQLKILPQQIQLLNLYFLNSLELEQRIKNELEENPFLDVTEEQGKDDDSHAAKDNIQDFEDWDEHGFDDIPDYKSEHLNYFDYDVAPDSPVVNFVTFKEDLKHQLSLLTLDDKIRVSAEYIIDILNQHGLMDLPLDEVTDDMSFHFHTVVETDLVQKGLAVVQTLDPIGVGACSTRECLLLQLKNMSQERYDVKCALALLDTHYNDLMHRQFDKIQHALKITDDELRDVLNLVGKLKFFPVTEEHRHDPKNTIIPDFIIANYDDSIQVSLYSSRADAVFINQSLYDQLASQTSGLLTL